MTLKKTKQDENELLDIKTKQAKQEKQSALSTYF